MGNHGSTCHYNTQIIAITENFNKIKSTWLRAKAVMMSCSLWMIFIGSFIFMLFSESACVLVSCCDNSKLNTYIYVIVHIKNLLLISHFNFFFFLPIIAIISLLFNTSNTKPDSDWLSYMHYILLIGWPTCITYFWLVDLLPKYVSNKHLFQWLLFNKIKPEPLYGQSRMSISKKTKRNTSTDKFVQN